jgi:hypothetical protein
LIASDLKADTSESLFKIVPTLATRLLEQQNISYHSEVTNDEMCMKAEAVENIEETLAANFREINAGLSSYKEAKEMLKVSGDAREIGEEGGEAGGAGDVPALEEPEVFDG